MVQSAPPSPPARFQLDLARYQLLKNGHVVHVERQPMDLLILLVRRPGELITRDEIAAKFWGKDVFVEADPSINRIVHKLRFALGDDSGVPRFLETVVGKGYRFIGRIDVTDERVAQPDLVTPPASLPVSPTPVSPRILEARFRSIGLVIVLIGVAGLMWFVARVWRARPTSATTAAVIHSVVVLPLQNLSGDASQDYFADGMTDELTTDLAKINALTVISRTSAVRYRHTQLSVPEIARELNVDALIEGSVVRSGKTVRITAQLVDAKTQRHLWAESYERGVEDVLQVQNAVALEIARQVRAKLTSPEQERIARRGSVNAEAYDAYLKGRYLLTTQSDDDLKGAPAAFRLAIRFDPAFAPAYAGLADAFSLLANYVVLPPDGAFPQAEAAANKALELDDSLPEAHASLAFARHHYDWDWPGAEREYRTALQLSPSYSSAHLRFAELLSTLGRHSEAVIEVQRAAMLDPLSPLMESNVGRVLYHARRYDQAIEQLRKALALDSTRVYARLYLAMSYEEKALYAEERQEWDKIREGFGGRDGVGYAHFCAVTGHSVEAKRVLSRLTREGDDMDWFFFGGVFAALGDKDEAFASLEKAYNRHDFFLSFIGVHPYMDPLRSDPRFASLLQRIGLARSPK